MKPRRISVGAWGGLLAILVAGCGPAGAPRQPSVPSASESAKEDCCDAFAAECPLCAVKPKLDESKSPPEGGDPAAYRRTKWLAPAERGEAGVLSLRVTDQDGQPQNLADLCDRPTALSFLYTRCTNPNKCPRVAREMAKLQALLEAEKLDSQVRLLIMTYDAEYDTPARLRRYGEEHGFRFTPAVRMLRPDLQAKDGFFEKLQVSVNYDDAGVNLHGVQLFLFDRQGRFVRRYHSVFWENEEVLGDLKRLGLEDAGKTP